MFLARTTGLLVRALSTVFSLGLNATREGLVRLGHNPKLLARSLLAALLSPQWWRAIVWVDWIRSIAHVWPLRVRFVFPRLRC